MIDPHLRLVRRATAGILATCLAVLVGLSALPAVPPQEPDGYGPFATHASILP